MTAIPVRHTPFASWEDPDAWMEAMKGPRWKKILKEEELLAKSYETNLPVSRFLTDLLAAKEADPEYPFSCGPAFVLWGSFIKTWWFKATLRRRYARDVATDGERLYVTTDVGKGSEKFELQCWDNACKMSPKWSFGPVGPDVATKDNLVYYLGVKNKLIYQELWCCNSRSGNQKHLIYEEKDPEVNLSLQKDPDGELLLICEKSQQIQSFKIKGKALHSIKESSNFPVGIDYGWKRMGILITKHHGQKVLWKSRTKLLEIPAGTILPDPFASWEGKTPLLIKVDTPEFYSTFYSLDFSGKLSLLSPRIPTGLVCKRYVAQSKDKTKVHYLSCYKKGTQPTKLLAIGYGAYGMPTSVNSIIKSWAPLFHNGWVIVTAFLRGGGDDSESWAKEGQLEGREKTIDDFEACIVSAQKRFGIDAKKTAIYGRSAGGLLLGGTLKRHPNASLMSAIYAEVPYVDELRTTTNPELPLTVLEYKEFGNPLHSLKDFINVGLLSPANSAAVQGSPEVFVLSRTAENDSQVFPYESVKWIRRLREHDKPSDAPKLCIVDKDQGHFATPDQALRERALDLAYLDAWMTGALKKYSV